MWGYSVPSGQHWFYTDLHVYYQIPDTGNRCLGTENQLFKTGFLPIYSRIAARGWLNWRGLGGAVGMRIVECVACGSGFRHQRYDLVSLFPPTGECEKFSVSKPWRRLDPSATEDAGKARGVRQSSQSNCFKPTRGPRTVYTLLTELNSSPWPITDIDTRATTYVGNQCSVQWSKSSLLVFSSDLSLAELEFKHRMAIMPEIARLESTNPVTVGGQPN